MRKRASSSYRFIVKLAGPYCLLTIKRSSLTVFFVILTLSIGLVSVNLPLSSSYTQNNALSQSGNGDAEQETGQLQSSEQNGQVVAGDGSILSGNDLDCQTQDNSNVESNLEGICESEGITNSLPNNDRNVLTVNVGVCGEDRFFNPLITVTDESDGSSDRFYATSGCTFPIGKEYVIPSGHSYKVEIVTNVHPAAAYVIFGADCVKTSEVSCRGSMGDGPQRVDVMVYYRH